MTLPPEEELLRRFTPDPQSGLLPIQAFRPTPADITGISVSRRDLPFPIRRVLSDTRHPAESYGVCTFNLVGLPELSAVLSPTDNDPGHATIPQIAPPYADLKKTDPRYAMLKAYQDQLHKRSQIIHRPGEAIV